MTYPLPERDWKAMRRIKDDLLAILCERINKESLAILSDPGKSEHEKYLALYKHIRESDHVVAECFNDWRRSKLLIRLSAIHAHGVLGAEHMQLLSDETQRKLKTMAEP